jgi:hypothetical protein
VKNNRPELMERIGLLLPSGVVIATGRHSPTSGHAPGDTSHHVRRPGARSPENRGDLRQLRPSTNHRRGFAQAAQSQGRRSAVPLRAMRLGGIAGGAPPVQRKLPMVPLRRSRLRTAKDSLLSALWRKAREGWRHTFRRSQCTMVCPPAKPWRSLAWSKAP